MLKMVEKLAILDRYRPNKIYFNFIPKTFITHRTL